MTNAEQKPALTPVKLLACMTPGATYSVPQIVRLAGYSAQEVQNVLSGCVVRGLVKQIHYCRRSIYRVPTKEEIGRDREQAARTVHHAILQGYDAANYRFRDLCMASHAPVQQAGQSRHGKRTAA